MQMGGIMGGFYRVSEWIMRFAYVNILWGLFTLAGLVLFGFMPATVAMFTVIRKWLMGETDIPVFKTFFASFKKRFSLRQFDRSHFRCGRCDSLC